MVKKVTIEQNKFKDSDLVMLRVRGLSSYTNTWWQVLFIDNDGTFIGKLSRADKWEYVSHKIGAVEKFNSGDVQRVYSEGENFCYSDNVTICDCSGLCRNK